MYVPSDRQPRCDRILAVGRDNFTPVASTKLRPIRTFFNEPERTVQTAFGSKSQPPLDNHTKTHWIVRYCDSEQKVAIAKAGLETVPDLPANTQFLEAGGAVSVDKKHDKRLQLLIDASPTLPDPAHKQLNQFDL